MAVLGGANATPEEEKLAELVGARVAGAGWVLLTGGGPGVMAAACRGARGAGGLTVGLLPVAVPDAGYPNRWVSVPLFTGAGSARNNFIVLSARFCVAIGGAAGTLSEVALALKAGREVVVWQGWRLEPAGDPEAAARLVRCRDQAQVIEAVEQRLNRPY